MAMDRAHIVPIALGLICAAFRPLGPAPAQADQLVWDNPAGGNASTANNWNPNQVPTPADELAFNLEGSYQVTFDGSLPETFNHRYRNGHVTVVFTVPHTMTGPFEIAGCCGDSARVTIPTGTLTCETQVEIGDESTPNGRLVLNDGDVHLIKTGPGNFLVGGGSGAGGYGRLDVSTGARIDIESGDLILGHNGTLADGRVAVSGFEPGGDRSRIVLTGAGRDIIVGNQNDATFSVSVGGSVSCESDILMAVGSGSIATTSVTGSTPGAFLSTLDDLDIAGNGVGVLQVQNNAFVTIGDRTRLVSGTGSGTLRVENGGKFVTQDLELSTGGTLDFRGGLIQVVGGVLDHDENQIVISSTTGAPVLELRNGASAIITASGSPFDRLRVGADGQGYFNLLNGASCTVASPAHLTIGTLAGGFGTVHLDSTSTLISTVIHAGVSGDAQVTVIGGSSLETNDLHIGLLSTGNGALDVIGAGSTAIVNDQLDVSGIGAAGGIGIITISEGGTMEVRGTGSQTNGVNTFIGNHAGTMNVFNGGTFISTAKVDMWGTLQLGGGTVNAQVLSLEETGHIIGTGTVNAAIATEDGGNATMTANGGPLTMGAPIPAGFVNGGAMAVESQLVTLVDSDGPRIGNTTIANGTLNFTGTATLSAQKTLSGEGLIGGAVANSGTIVATGAGLSFDGLVTGIGQGISGTLIRFLDDGGYTGAGTINARVDGDPGSVITAIGNLTLGNAASTTGVVLDGELHVGAQNVTLRDSDGINLGLRTTLAGGQLGYVGSTLILPVGRELAGGGFIASTLKNGGHVIVGTPSVMLLRVTPEFSNLASGVVEIDLGNHATIEHDVVQVTNEVNLAGTLLVRALPTFNAQVGDEYTVMTWGTRNGTFETVTFAGFGQGTQFQVIYNATSLVVRVTAVTTGMGTEEPGEVPAESSPQTLTLTALTDPGAPPALELGLPRPAHIRLSLYDVAGRQVAELFAGPAPAGWHRYSVPSGTRLARGVYFGRSEVVATGRMESRVARLVLVR